MRCKDEGIEQSDGAFCRLGNTAHDAQVARYLHPEPGRLPYSNGQWATTDAAYAADSVARKMSYDKLRRLML